MQNKENKLLTANELSFFTGQIALMLESGVSMYESIQALAVNFSNGEFKAPFALLLEEVELGSTLAAAMAKAGIFPHYALKMTEIGETTGKLEYVMRSLSRHYDREYSLNVSLKNAVRYPAVLLAIMAVVVLVLNISVLPLFKQVLSNLGVASSKLASTTMTIGTVIGIVALILICAIFAVGFMLTALIKNGKRQKVIELACRIVPSFAQLEKNIAAEQFLSVMSIALGAGYPPENAAEMCEELATSAPVAKKISTILKEQAEDGSLSKAITKSGLLDPLKARMVEVGFMTGKADSVTLHVSKLYAEETDALLTRLLALIEPSLVAVLAVIIGCILLTVMLPLAGVMSSFI